MNGTASRRLRILEIETFGRGGLTHYAYNLSCALAERGHEVILMTAAAFELGDRVMPPGVRVLKTIARSTWRHRESMSARAATWARRLEAVVDAFLVAASARRLRPDVIHLHCTNPISLAHLMLLKMLHVPLSATAHVVTPHEPIRFQEAVYRRIHRFPDLIVAHSRFDRQRLLEEFDVDCDRVVVIPHGEYGFFESAEQLHDRVAARRDLGLAIHDEVALFFGYIREYKGLDLLLEAWETVLEARPEARLVVAGDPVRLSAARREELAAWATRLGVVHRFDYIPFSEVSRYFAAADVLAMPYRHISQSGVLYLSLALGVPVVATTVGALPEVLSDGDSAVLVPPESPPALAKALIRVLGDPELRDRLARGGRRVAERHSWPRVAERTEDAFSGLAAGYRDRS